MVALGHSKKIKHLVDVLSSCIYVYKKQGTHLLITIGPLETFSESINTFVIPTTTFRNIIQVFEPVGMMRVVVDEQDGLKKKN